MISWSVGFKLEAESDLAGIDSATCRRITEKINWLSINLDFLFPVGLKGEFKEFYKLRVGDWRVFYQTNWVKHSIIVCYIDRRDKAYKKKR